MPRTVDVEVHRLRRDAFLDVAQRLIQTRGYERMSIQDVLAELGTSKGALYHYFDSKQALLDGVVERLADAALARVSPILADPSLPALRKLERVVGGIAGFKAEHRELMVAIIEVWTSDANVLVREKVRRLTASRLGPIFSAIVRQGIAEGTVRTSRPEETAQVVLLLVQAYQELAVQQFLARRAREMTFEEVARSYAAFTEALERTLGVPAGAVRLPGEATLRFWFDDFLKERAR